jgi:hypothetical protein
LDDLLAAEMQRDEGITQNTRDKESRVWHRWVEYTRSIEICHDVWMSELHPEQRTYVIEAFAAALRRREFSRPDEKFLVASTVQEAMAKLGEIFRANVGYNPTHGTGSQSLHPLLTRQFKGMRNLDPGEVQQKALPVSVYRELHHQAAESLLALDAAIAWLQTMAFFWCMRSCEYSNVQGERRTKILCVRNLRFFDKLNKDISSDYSDLHEKAVTVSITFEFQKKEVRNDTISHQHSGDKIDDGKMCPVRAAIEIVLRIVKYNHPADKVKDIQVNYMEFDGKGFTIPSTMILSRIRQAVVSLGHAALGFHPEEVGTHSNRSGGTMGMFLAETPVYTIMLMGRWSSDAFMSCIRNQVLSLSHGIAAKMLTYEQFYTVPDFIHTTANGDSRSRSSTNLATSTNFNGSHANMRRGMHPAFHLSH